MAENIQKTQNAQLYFGHNSAQMVFLVRKNCKRLRGFLHKKSIFIWFISIFILILHPEKEIDFQKRTNHNYIKNTNCWNIQKLQKPRRDVGAFGFLLIQKRFLLYATLNAKKDSMTLHLHVSNNDVAYKYEMIRSKKNNPKSVIIYNEVSGFNFPEQTTTFLYPQIGPMTG